MFVWLCNKEMSDIEMKDQNGGDQEENGSGLQY